jgi:hypothetical protein
LELMAPDAKMTKWDNHWKTESKKAVSPQTAGVRLLTKLEWFRNRIDTFCHVLIVAEQLESGHTDTEKQRARRTSARMHYLYQSPVPPVYVDKSGNLSLSQNFTLLQPTYVLFLMRIQSSRWPAK